MRTMIPVVCLSVGVLFAGIPANAQDMTFGKFEYENSCVACHGVSGSGDGPVSDFLSGAVPSDLTVLQKNNGGVFPVTVVYEMIDGSAVASAHGTRDMPIWGKRFRERIEQANDPIDEAMAPENYAKVRILALIEYLASIQVQ